MCDQAICIVLPSVLLRVAVDPGFSGSTEEKTQIITLRTPLFLVNRRYSGSTTCMDEKICYEVCNVVPNIFLIYRHIRRNFQCCRHPNLIVRQVAQLLNSLVSRQRQSNHQHYSSITVRLYIYCIILYCIEVT